MEQEQRSETLLFSDAILRLINFTHDNYGSSFLEEAKDIGYKLSKEFGQKAATEKIGQILKQWGTELAPIADPEKRMTRFKELVEEAKK